MKSFEKENMTIFSNSTQFQKYLKDYSLFSTYTSTHYNGINVVIMNATTPNEIACAQTDLLSSGLATIKINPDTEHFPPRPQKHKGFEFIFVANGSYTSIIEDHTYRLKKFDAILMNQNCKNMMTEFDNLIAIVISLSQEYLSQNHLLKHLTSLSTHSRFDANYRNAEYTVFRTHDFDVVKAGEDCTQPPPLPHQQKEAVKQLLYQLYHELKEKQTGYNFIITGLIHRLFDYLSRDTLYFAEHKTEKYIGDEELAEHIKLYLDNNPRKITIGELTQIFFYNRNHLSNVFSKQVSRSIKEYNNAVCMEEAKRLLTETSLSVSDIAKQLNFQSRSQFYNMFREYYGCLPKDLRQ